MSATQAERAITLLLALDQDIADKIAAADGLRYSMLTLIDPSRIPSKRPWTFTHEKTGKLHTSSQAAQPGQTAHSSPTTSTSPSTPRCVVPGTVMTPPSSGGPTATRPSQRQRCSAPPPMVAMCSTCTPATTACTLCSASAAASTDQSPHMESAREGAVPDSHAYARPRGETTSSTAIITEEAVAQAERQARIQANRAKALAKRRKTAAAVVAANSCNREDLAPGARTQRNSAQDGGSAGVGAVGGASAAGTAVYNTPTREQFVTECSRKAASILGLDVNDFSFRPNQQALIEAVFDGANTAAILPVGGGKNLILNACAQAATQLKMKRGIIVEVSFFRTLIFAQLDEFGDETTYITPVEAAHDEGGSKFAALPACEANPATALHVVAGAVGVGKNVIVTTPEFLVGDSGRSINARDDIEKFVGAGRLLAVFIDEGQTFKLQRELRGVAFAKFVQFLGLLHGTAGIAGKLLSIVVTTGTLPGSEPHELFQWLKIPMDRLLRAPLNRPHISLAVDEIPAISWSECDNLWGAVNSSIGTFQRWFHSLGPEVQRQVPGGSSMMIFLHRRSDVDMVTRLLNADASKAARCVCHRECALGAGCREQNVPTAVAYHSGLADDVKRNAFTTEWCGGESARKGAAVIIVSTSILEQGINRPHVLAALSPCGPPPTLSNLAQGIWGRTMRACSFPAFASVTWCYRLMWRVVYRSGSMEPGSQAFHGLNAVAKHVIRSMRSCGRANLLVGLSCPTVGTDFAPTCHEQCCSYGTSSSWQTRPRKVRLTDATDRARLFIQHVNGLAAESSWFPHASLGRVLGYDGDTPEWRAGLTECRASRLMDSFIAPEAGIADIAYLYRPKGSWTMCVGVHTSVCSDGDGLYHMAAY